MDHELSTYWTQDRIDDEYDRQMRDQEALYESRIAEDELMSDEWHAWEDEERGADHTR